MLVNIVVWVATLWKRIAIAILWKTCDRIFPIICYVLLCYDPAALNLVDSNLLDHKLLMDQICCNVAAFWDDEAQVWTASSQDVLGLATEAATLEELTQKLRIMVPELLRLHWASSISKLLSERGEI